MRKRIYGAAVLLLLTACAAPAQQTTAEPQTLPVQTATPTQIQTEPPTQPPTEAPKPFDYTFCFTGDVSLADDARTTRYWLNHDRDITQCIDKPILDKMRAADICVVDNEFQFSTRGTPTSGKEYTFEGDPENVQGMLDMGADLMLLANNHTYDYGADALVDTLETLENAGLAYIGAGRNLEEASRTCFVRLDGVTVAFLNGTRVEWSEQTKGATETEPGVFRTVDPQLLYQRTREAAEIADYVIVFMHWGVEGSTDQESYQTQVGRGLINSGADAVLGCHTHCLQGVEFYDGKPIAYSLGNFWFNGKTCDSTLAQLHISGTADHITTKLELVPALQTDSHVVAIDGSDNIDAFYHKMESWSSAYGTTFDRETGYAIPGYDAKQDDPTGREGLDYKPNE